MRENLVVTILGPDRKGLVEALARQIAAVGGNWEESRMARLEGQFAGILLISIDAAKTDALHAAVRELETSGLQVTVRPAATPPHAGDGTRAHVEVTGHDRPGIIRDVARVLAELGANVEDLDSTVASAAMSGDRMFTARIELHAPAGLELATLRTRLEALAGELMVDVEAD